MLLFIIAIGGNTYALLGDLPAASKSLDKLKEALWKDYEPKPVIIVEQFQFYCRNQAANEPLTEYKGVMSFGNSLCFCWLPTY